MWKWIELDFCVHIALKMQLFISNLLKVNRVVSSYSRAKI